MREKLDGLFQRYGTEVTIVGETGSRQIRGFFQAVNARSWQSMESEASLLGEITRGQYVFLGPAGAGFGEGDTLLLGQRQYLLRRVEPFWAEDQVLYLWGLCVEKGDNDTWEIPS